MTRFGPFALERYFARYEFSVQYLLCSSDCESFTVDDILNLEPGSSERLHKHWLGYTESLGNPALRREISRLYSNISDDDILVHAGAEEAIFLFMHALLGPGDEIIVHSPCYQSLTEIAKGLGCRVIQWRAREEAGWSLDLNELKSKISGKTKCVVINSPHNPTGFLMSRQNFSELQALADQRGIVLFSDEVYREAEHDPTSRLPSACEQSDSAVALGVMSKTYGLAGLRIGWVATKNRALLEKMAHLKDYTTICNSAPSELLAEIALRHRKRLVERNLGIIRGNLDLLKGFFDENQDRFTWQPPIAGPIAFPRLIRDDADVFCHKLVTEQGVLLLPGSVYGDYRNHFRIGFGRKNLPAALDRLDGFLA